MNEENKEVFKFYKKYVKCFSYLSPPQYLAILFFQKVYKSFWDDLPGVEDDEKELNAVLKKLPKKSCQEFRRCTQRLEKNSSGF